MAKKATKTVVINGVEVKFRTLPGTTVLAAKKRISKKMAAVNRSYQSKSAKSRQRLSGTVFNA